MFRSVAKVSRLTSQTMMFSNRHQSTFSPRNPGIYVHATEDAIFKRVMADDEARDSFLSSVLGEQVTDSEIMDQYLNPMQSYVGLRELLNNNATKDLMKKIKESGDQFFVINSKIGKTGKQAMKLLQNLAARHEELMEALSRTDRASEFDSKLSSFPSFERNPQLDLVCKTAAGLVNVEVQVNAQDYWDIRILNHACGLFCRQFSKGFKWADLEEDPIVAREIRKAIGVSIMEKPPKISDKISVPWYDITPWQDDELRRHFTLTESQNPNIKRKGLEFFDYNLSALKHLDKQELLKKGGVELKEWMEFLAEGYMKTKEQVAAEITSSQVRKAYGLVESSTLPEKIKRQYEDAFGRRYNISHSLDAERKEGREEGREEGKIEGKIEIARKMLKQKMSISNIAEITGLPIEEIKKLSQEKV